MKYLALRIEGIDFEVPTPKGFRLTSLENLFQFLFEFLLIIAIILSVIFFILGGIQWITSQGSKEGVQKAKGRITYAIIGLIIALLAIFIVNVIGGFFNSQLIAPPPINLRNIKPM